MPRCPEQQVSAVSGQPSSVATQLQQPTPAVLQQPGTHDATVIIDDGHLTCILCNKYVTEEHMQSARHKRKQAWHDEAMLIAAPPAPPPPAVLQQPRAHDANVIMTDDGYLKCTLCNKYVTEGHLQSRQHKRLLAAQEAKEEPADIFRSLGDDFRDDDGQPTQQPEMTTTRGYTYTRVEWDEWHARNVNETVDT